MPRLPPSTAAGRCPTRRPGCPPTRTTTCPCPAPPPRSGSRCRARPTGRRSPTRPVPGMLGARVALSRTAGSVLTMPEAVGTDHAACRRRGRCGPARPAAPALRARLGEPGGDHDQRRAPPSPALLDDLDRRRRRARRPRPGPPRRRCRDARVRPHARHAPGLRVAPGTRARRSRRPAGCAARSWPTPPGSRLAPMTATDPGRSSRAIDRASARCSRACARPRSVSVGRCRASADHPVGEPALRPCSRPGVEHRRSSSGSPAARRRRNAGCRAPGPRRPGAPAARRPRPRPWWASSTRKATSASPGPVRS